MGQKVNPIGLRVGIIRDWESNWYASPKDFAGLLYEDYLIRKTIKSLPVPNFGKKIDADGHAVIDPKTGKEVLVVYKQGVKIVRVGESGSEKNLKPEDVVYKKVSAKVNPKDIITLSSAGIASINIERPRKDMISVKINAAKPGIIITKNGKEAIDYVKNAVHSVVKNIKPERISVNVVEIKSQFTNAQIVAETVKQQIEKRISFKRAMKSAVNMAMKNGAKGIKVRTSGRLGGAEMARVEKENAGKVPLHTLRADIDYGFAEAWTQYGHIGVKVWIYLDDVATGSKRVLGINEKKPKARKNTSGKKSNSKFGGKPGNGKPKTGRRITNSNKGDK